MRVEQVLERGRADGIGRDHFGHLGIDQFAYTDTAVGAAEVEAMRTAREAAKT